jgi:methyl-accepting chemotaxis protein
MKIVTFLKISLGLIIFLSLAGTMSMAGLHHFTAKERAVVADQAQFKQLGQDLMAASDDLTNWARAYVQYGDKNYYNLYMGEVEKVKRREAVVQGLKDLNAPQEEQALVQKALGLSNTLAVLEGKAFEAAEKGDFETARQLVFSPEYENGKQPIVATLQEFDKVMNGRANADVQSASNTANTMFIVAVVVFAFILLTVFASFVLIYRKIRPINKLMDATDEVANGNFCVVVDIQSQDELGELAGHFRKFIHNVSAVLKDSKSAVNDTMDANSGMVSTMEELSTTFQNQNAAVASVASAMEEMTATSAEVKGSMASTMQEVNSVLRLTKSGVERLADIQKQMDQISGKTGQLAGTIKELGAASEEIEEILEVINEIADQTNLLALNAAIEAARAGDAGRGFAVVADEVRKLAERTQKATGEIETIISALQKSSSTALKEMTDTETSIHNGVEIINSTQGSFKEIVNSTEAAGKNVAQMEGTITDQAEAIINVNESSQTIASGLEQCVHAVDQITSTVMELHKKAEKAHEAIDFFKVD